MGFFDDLRDDLKKLSQNFIRKGQVTPTSRLGQAQTRSNKSRQKFVSRAKESRPRTSQLLGPAGFLVDSKSRDFQRAQFKQLADLQGPSGVTLGQAASRIRPTDFGKFIQTGVSSLTKPVLGQRRADIFGRTVSTPAQIVGTGVTNILKGGAGLSTSPTTGGSLRGLGQGITGFGQVLAGPLTPIPSLIAGRGGDTTTARLSGGFLRGISGDETLASNVQFKPKTVTIGDTEFSIDPIQTVGNMIGFIQNPVNKTLFKATEGINLLRGLGIGTKVFNFLATNTVRGGIEDILLSIDEFPAEASQKEKADFIKNAFVTGAVTEIGGRVILGGASKAIDNKLMASVFDALKKLVNKNDFPKGVEPLATKSDDVFTPKPGREIREIPVSDTKIRIDRRTGKRIEPSGKGIGKEEVAGVIAGIETDEEGKIRFDPGKAALGVAGISIGSKALPELRKAIGSVKSEKLPLETKQADIKDIPSTKVKLADRGSSKGSLLNIIPPKGRGNIRPPRINFRGWKDSGAIGLGRETMERNIERVAGKDANKIKDFLVEPLRKNEASRVEFNNQKRALIRDKVVKEFGIKAGSEEDKLIQRFGEKRITLKELKETTDNWQNVQKAASLFRKQYDEMLNSINSVRAEFGYKPIPKRKDYFRHYQEIGGLINQFGLIFRKQDLPTEIAGLTDVFKPGKPFTTAELQRKGGEFTESAIQGFDNYLDSVSRQMFHIDSVQRGRTLEKFIREQAVEGNANLPNFVSNLKEWTNLVSGKKAQFDRGFEQTFGRGFYKTMNWLRSRTAANMVGGNISSALTNFIPLTQFGSTTGKQFVAQGLLDGTTSALRSDFNKIGDIKSEFLTTRFPDQVIDPTKIQKASEFAGWLFESIDKFTSRSIVSGKYFENLAKGMNPENAIRNADAYAGRVLARRTVGELPNLLNTRSLGFITQFQTEINNMFSFISKDIPSLSGGNKKKLASMMTQFAVYSWVFNNIYEKLTGRRPTIDPVYFAATVGGLTEEGKDKPLGERTLAASKDLAENLPFTGGITGGRFPIGAALPDVPGLIRGERDLGRELTKPAFFLAPPFGGSQIKKTIEGINLVKKGQSETPSGRVRFKAPESTAGKAKAIVFGQYSTPEARTYFAKDRVSASIDTVNAREIFDAIDGKSKEEKLQIVRQAINDGTLTDKGQKTLENMLKDKKTGITKEEKRLRNSTVKKRSDTIKKQLKKIKGKDKKKEYLIDLERKGILTDSVLKELLKSK